MGMFPGIKPPKTYEQYVVRASIFEMLFLRRKAIETMKDAVKQPFSKKERGSGLIYLGILHAKARDLRAAADCFREALEAAKDETFPYSANFDIVMRTFLAIGETQVASYWLDELSKRQLYDKRFAKLAKWKKRLP